MTQAISSSPRIAVIGGGISGLAASQMLKQKGCIPTIYESKDKVGGLISCSVEQGHLFHRVGGHVFNSKNSAVLEWFWDFFDKESEFLKAFRNAVIFMDEKIIPYPIERYIKMLPKKEARTVVRELLELRAKGEQSSGEDANYGHQSFGDFLLGNFGETLCSKYFFPYNKKIWNRDLYSIPLPWLKGKLPMSSPSQIIEDNILCMEEGDMVHSSFYYPKSGGSQFIANRLAVGIEIIFEMVATISSAQGKFFINSNSTPYDQVVYTCDTRALPSMLERDSLGAFCDQLADILKDTSLDSNGTSNLLCECDANNYSWVYLPSDSTRFHRIIMTGNFSPSNNSTSIPPGRVSCTIESSGLHSKEDLEQELMSLPFNPKAISYNYCPNSYIVHRSDTQLLLDQIKDTCREQGIHLCGRFAEWEYYNMDAAIESAMDITDDVIKWLSSDYCASTSN